MSSCQQFRPAPSTTSDSAANLLVDKTPNPGPRHIFLQTPQELHEEYTWRSIHIEAVYDMARATLWHDLKTAPPSHEALIKTQIEMHDKWMKQEIDALQKSLKFQQYLWFVNARRHLYGPETESPAGKHLDMLANLLQQDIENNGEIPVVSVLNKAHADEAAAKAALDVATALYRNDREGDRASVLQARREMLAYKSEPARAPFTGFTGPAAPQVAPQTSPKGRLRKFAPKPEAEAANDAPSKRSSV